MRTNILVTAALAIAAGAVRAPAQVPDPRAHHQLVHDAATDRVWLIGGSTPQDGGHHYFDDTWTWDGEAWTRGPDLPFPRSSHSVAYDPDSESLLLFGGTSGGSANVEGVVLERREGEWVERARDAAAALGATAACMDRRRGTLVVYGGAEPGGTFTGATWEWDGSELRPVADGPGARLGHAMVWDPVGERCLLFGGRDAEGEVRADTWAWDGRKWTRLDVAGPPARWIFTMTADPARGRVVLFGGQDPDGGLLGDTWAWDGAAWTRLATDGPEPRMMGAMAATGEGVVLFGGRARAESGYRDMGDTWVLEDDAWRRAGKTAARGSRPAEGYLEGDAGARIHYRVLGSAPDTVVVVHGGPGAGMNAVLPELRPLADRHTLVFYDQRGGGRSELPADTTLLEARHHVADLEAVRHFFGLERMSLVAHSFGSILVARYARENPGRVERIAFFGAVGPRRAEAAARARAAAAPADSALQRRLQAVMGALLAGSSADPVADCREYEAVGREMALARGESGEWKGTNCAMSPESVRYYFRYTAQISPRSFGDWDFTESLDGLEAPLLVIHGDLDPGAVAEQRAWAAAVPNGRALSIPGAGKAVSADRPELFFPAVETFLGGEWPAGAESPR